MEINLINPYNGKILKETEKGLIDQEGNLFLLNNGVYKFVNSESYASSFGYQWNKFQKTQIDKYSGNTLSRDRFSAVTRWDKSDLTGKNILEVGSGAGRFTQIVLDHTKANLYSVDYSNAIEANFENNGPNQRLKLFQANIYQLPFEKESFDKVFCFGVLQHTPYVKQSVRSLIDMAKPGGEVIVDFYPLRGWWTKINMKYLLRPITKKINHERLLSLISRNIDWMITLSKFFIKIKMGRLINRFIPICDIRNLLSGLNPQELREWAILDTFDMFSPEYDQPQRISVVKKWFTEMGMTEIFGGLIKYGDGYEAATVRGTKGN